MSNNFYNHGSFPTTGSAATSASMRAELDSIAAGFDKMPTLTGNANEIVVVSPSGTELTTIATLPATSGGTGFASYAVGDLVFANTTSTLAKLADVATGNALISGGVGVAPSYGKIGLTTHVTGTLPVANGGTGITSFGTGVATALGINVGTAGAFVVNGGALGTPSSGTLTNATGLPVGTGISGLGTNVATALAVNVGTAGAFVVNGGALGTPSSGTVTNLTGTASININGTVGATTPSTGAFTTLTTSGNVTLGDASTDTVTVNGYMGVGGAANTARAVDVSSSALSGTTQDGVFSRVTGTSGATALIRGFAAQPGTAAAAFTVSDVAGFVAINPSKGAGSTITNAHGVFIGDHSQGTNNYGITSTVSSGTNKWNIYASGTAANYFAGNVGVGTTTPVEGLEVVSAGAAFRTSKAVNAISNTRLYGGAYTGNLATIAVVNGANGANNLYFGGGTGAGEPATNIIFHTGTAGATGSGTERVRLDSAGNVGIGTSSPSVSGLDVSRATGSATPTPVELRLATTTSASDWSTTDPWGRISFYSADASSGGAKVQAAIQTVAMGTAGGTSSFDFLVTDNANGTLFKALSLQPAGTNTTQTIFYSGSGTERMRIDTSGNVGIGTSSPEFKLTAFGALSSFNTRSLIFKNTYAGPYSAGFFANLGATTARPGFECRGGFAGEYNGAGWEINEGNILIFYSGTSSERMRLDSAGNLGLGVTPSAWASTYKAFEGGFGATGGFAVSSTGSTADVSQNAYHNGTNWIYKTTNLSSFYRQQTGQHSWFTAPSGTAGNAITFTQAMTLDSSGRLLVGTTANRTNALSSGTNLQIEGINSAASAAIVRNEASTTGSFIALAKSRGTAVGSFTAVVSGDSLGQVSFQGADGTALVGAAAITAQVDGTPGTNDMPGRLVFSTTADGGSSPTERMRIDSSGNINIATAGARITGDFSNATVASRVMFQTSTVNSTTAVGVLPNGTSSTSRLQVFGASDPSNTAVFGLSIEANAEARFNAAITGTGTYLPITFLTGGSERMRIDTSGNVGIGTSSPSKKLDVFNSGTTTTDFIVRNGTVSLLSFVDSGAGYTGTSTNHPLLFTTNGSERARIDSSGNFLIGRTDTSFTVGAGFAFLATKGLAIGKTSTADLGSCLYMNRATVGDGALVEFAEGGVTEGNISISGTTVSYNGAHLSRWAQMLTKPDLLKGTVMSNLDEMNVYVDKDGNPVENEQLNKVKVSDVEGDANVAGVFVNWTYDEAHDVDEINMAMTGDMIIRIAQGVVVHRGDLLMSAGDGTAKPQGDDIVRSKTVAKVTSNHVTCTYDDGSYCVPCVLMAC